MATQSLMKRKAVVTRRRLIITFVLATILTVSFATGYTSGVYTPTLIPDGERNIMWAEPPKAGTPSDYDLLSDLKYTAQKIYSSGYFRGVTVGDVIADLGIIKYKQHVHNIRVVKGDTVFSEAISSSSLKSVAEQKYIKGDTVLFRPSVSVNGESATFSDTVGKMELEEFYKAYGAIPNEITKHYIHEDVILSVRDENALSRSALNTDGTEDEPLINFDVPQSLTTDADGNYIFTLDLDPVESTKYSRNEVKTLAGADNNPTFSSVRVTFCINSDFLPVWVRSVEVYDIAIPVIGAMTCTSTLTETFYDIGDTDADIPEKDFFESHIDSAGDIDTETKLSPSDYLASAFSEYLDGSSNLDLTADVAIDGLKLDSLKLSVNIGTMNVRAKLGALAVEYADDKLYLTKDNIKGYMPVSAIAELMKDERLSALIGTLPDLSGALGGDILSKVFENCEMTSENGVTRIHLIFELTEGVDIDASLYINDEDMTLNGISGTVKALGHEIKVESKPEHSDFPEIDGTYKDFSALTDFIPDALTTALGTTYGINGNIDVMGTPLGVNAYIDRRDGLKVDATVSVMGSDVSVKYLSNTIYAALGNIRIKAGKKDLPVLIDAVTDIIPIELPDIDIATLLPDSIDGYLAVLDSLDVTENKLSVGLKLNGIKADIAITRASGALDGVELGVYGKALGKDISLGAKLKLTAPAPREVTAVGNYTSLSEISALLPSLKQYINAKALDVAFDASLTVNDKTVPVSGDVQINIDGGVAVSAMLNALGQDVTVAYVSDALYVSIGNIDLKLDIADTANLTDEVKKLLGSFGIVMPEFDLDGIELPAVISAIKSFDVKDGMLTAAIGIADNSVTLSVTPKTGDVKIDAVIDGLGSVGATAAVKPVSPAVIAAPDGAFCDIAELGAALGTVTEIVENKSLSVPITLDLGELAFDANIDVSFGDGLAVRLTEKTLPLELVYINDTAYIASNGILVSGTLSDVKSLIDALGDVIPEKATELIGGLKGFDVSNISGIVDATLGAVKYLYTADGVLYAGIDLDGVTLDAQLNADLSGGTVNVALGKTAITAGIGNIRACGKRIAVPDGKFVPAAKFIPVINAVMPLVDKQGYALSLDGTVFGAALEANVELDVADKNSLAMHARLALGDVRGIELTLLDNTLYVDIPGTLHISLDTDKDSIAALKAQLQPIMPNTAANALGSLVSAFKGIKDRSISEILACFTACDAQDGFELTADLAPLGAELAAKIDVRVSDVLDGLNLSADVLGKTFVADVTVETNDGGVLTGMTVTADGITLGANLLNTDKQTISVSGEYMPVTLLTQYVKPIATLVADAKTANSLSLALDAQITKTADGKFMKITCDDLTMSLGKDFALTATVTLFADTADAQDIDIVYTDGVLYLKLGEIALSFDTNKDIETLYDTLAKYLPDYLAKELQKLLGLSDGASELSEISLLIDRLKSIATADGAESIVSALFSKLGGAADRSAVAAVLDMIEIAQADGKAVILADIMGITLRVAPSLKDDRIENINIRTSEILGMTVNANASFALSSGEFTVTKPDGEYVPVVDFVNVIDCAIGTFTTVNPQTQNEITFEVPSFSFGIDNYATETAAANTITVTGNGASALRGKFTKYEEVKPDGSKTYTYGAALEAHVTISSTSFANTTGALALDLYLVDNHPAPSTAYLKYSEQKTGFGELVSIDTKSVLEMLAAAMDIIGVDDKTVELLLGDYRRPIDSSIFDSMDIAGLDGLKDTLNSVADAVRNAKTALDDVRSALDIVKKAGSVDELMNKLPNIKSLLNNAIGSFKTIKELLGNEKTAVSAEPENTELFDAALLKRIVNGVSFYKGETGTDGTTTIGATVNNAITTGATGTANIEVTENNGAINGISVSDLDVNTALINANVTFIAGGEIAPITAPQADIEAAATEQMTYSDLSKIKHLLFDVMNTANLREFEIGGLDTSDVINVKLNLGALSGLANMDIDIRYDIKVKIIRTGTDKNGKPIYKTAAAVELNYKDCFAKIANVDTVVVADCTTRLFFYDNVLYVQGVSGWDDEREMTVGTTQKIYTGKRPSLGYKVFTSAPRYSDYKATVKPYIHYVYAAYTVDEFMYMIQNDMTRFLNEFLFYLVPLSKSFTFAHIDLQKTITEQIGGSSGESDASGKTLAQIFKGYSYDGSTHKMKLGLKELTGSSALGDLNVALSCLGDGDDDATGNLLNNYVKGLHVDTSVKDDLITVKLDATLRNIRESSDGKTIYSAGFAPTDVTTVNGSFMFDGKPYIAEYNNYEQDVIYTLDGTLYSAGEKLYTENGRLTRFAHAASASYKEDKNIANIAGEPDYKLGDVSYQNHYTYTLTNAYSLSDPCEYYVGTDGNGAKYVYRYGDNGAKIRVELRSITDDFLADVSYDENGNTVLTNKENGVNWNRIWQNAA